MPSTVCVPARRARADMAWVSCAERNRKSRRLEAAGVQANCKQRGCKHTATGTLSISFLHNGNRSAFKCLLGCNSCAVAGWTGEQPPPRAQQQPVETGDAQLHMARINRKCIQSK